MMTPGKYQAWSPHEIARLNSMWDTGLTIKRIAQELGRSPGSIQRKARDSGLPPRYPSGRPPTGNSHPKKAQRIRRGVNTLPKLNSEQ